MVKIVRNFTKGLTKKKIIIIASILATIILATSGVLIFNGLNGSKDTSMQGDVLYMEETVAKQDIVVGVSESGTASLLTTDVSLESGMTVQEILVSTGKYVTEGEVIASVNLDDYEQTSSDELTSLANAQIEASSLNIQTESKLIEAQKTYDKSVENGLNAKTVYDLEIAEINAGLSSIDTEIAELNTQIASIENQIANGLDNDYGIADKQTQISLTQSDISSLNTKIAETTDEIELDLLKTDLKKLEEEFSSLQSELVKIQEEYDNSYSALPTQLANLQSQLSSKNTSRTKYVSTMESSKIEAKATYDLTMATYNNAKTVYDNTVASLQTSLDAAQDKVTDLETSINETDEDTTLIIDDMGNVLAPCTGYIMSITQPSASANANNNNENASPLTISIADSTYAEVSVSIAQEDIGDVEVGMDVNVLFDAYENMVVPAYVDRIAITTSSGISASVSYTVTIACAVPEEYKEEMAIYHGMTATTTFVLKQKQDVLAVSSKCIKTENGIEYATLLNSDGTLEQVEVVTGFSDGFDVEIVSGLKEGDVVIIESAVNSIAR